MFRKVLIADDLGSINAGVRSVAESLGIAEVDQVQYCDDAWLKLKKGVTDGAPYDLLITDLSFKSDHREQRLHSGDDLIAEAKQYFPELKVIAYSMEDRLQRIRILCNNFGLDGYVCKGRRGLQELEMAIGAVYDAQNYLSPEVSQALHPRSDLEVEEFDVELIKQLSLGLSQDDISKLFRAHHISPSSLSSIEKRINKLKIQFKANNAIHLVAIFKDLGFI
ncbi:response regulator transcription factor [Robertkochia solimangrovi]|uniref:response regulator transcription factor n=1 Tax=Robertkochia solimangrovi TaxID=2213046 RepID=UPI00117E62EC|nr:response regulator transcription factor [Robertkochia solimangrovi]TRZ46112.1 response regulator [Robertkochia solimangrovi]